MSDHGESDGESVSQQLQIADIEVCESLTVTTIALAIELDK